ncbi:MAG: hypothetical protein ABUL69_03305 [Peristeroidobacter soli]
MKRISLITLIVAALVGVGTAVWLNADEPRKTPYWPKPTPPPPASQVFETSRERAPTAEEIAEAASSHDQQLELTIERALAARDPQQRETAFTFLLPELLQVAPKRVVATVKRQEPGEARDLLLDEVARLWIQTDVPTAIDWINSLEGGERMSAANKAVSVIAARDPAGAIELADKLKVGGDDGSLAHLVQLWAVEDPEAAWRWIETQPDSPRTEQLRARIKQARKPTNAARD